MRGVAILYIVLAHSLYVNTTKELHSLTVLYDRLFSEGTTLFVLISGYLFYYLRTNFEYKNFIGKKIKNVISPYILISIPAIIIYCTGLKTNHDWINMHWFGEIALYAKVGYMYLTGGHLGPYWYIPVIAMIFLVSPITVYCTDYISGKLLAVICIVIPLFIVRPEGNSNIVQSFLHFYPIYIFGGLLYLHKKTWFELMNSRISLVVLFSLYIISVCLAFTSFSIAKFLDKIMLFFILYIALYRLHSFCTTCRFWRLLDFVAVFSFPIYFIHGYLISTTKLLMGGIVFADPLYYTAYVTFIFLLSISMSIFTAMIVVIIFKQRSHLIVGINYKELKRYNLRE